MIWKVNTSNPGKLEEFRRYLGNVEAIQQDLDEPDADLITIIRYKASQFESVLVDDTSLAVEGETVGANIRWFLDHLPKHIGKKATFTCLLAIHRNNKIEIYKGETSGKIVEPKGTSFGFNKYFLPDGETKTFGEIIPDRINPRYLAIQRLLENRAFMVENGLPCWDGHFQNES